MILTAALDLFAFPDLCSSCQLHLSPYGNSDHNILLYIGFPSNSKVDASCHHTTCYCSCADRYKLRDYVKMFCGRIYFSSVLLLLLPNFMIAPRLKLLHISLMMNMRSSPVLVIANRNHFLWLYQWSELSVSNTNFRQARACSKNVF